ncbi:pre-tRNA nuclear export protein [Savitreella phatthalungensis]
MEDSLEQAVEIALRQDVTDPSLRQQATDFCTQVKDSPDGWQLCLSLFQQQSRRSQNSRFFALQVLEDALRHRAPQIGEASIDLMRQALMPWLAQNLLTDNSSAAAGVAEYDPPYLRNKLAEIISLLFVHLYTSTWTSFFQDFYALIPKSSRAADFFFRVCVSIEQEIADVLIVRNQDEAKRATLIKDEIRARDMAKLPEVWFSLFDQYRESDKGIVAIGLRVVGAWASWMDISLIVNEPFMTFLFNLLKDSSLKTPACEALIGIVSKKMALADKVQLISLLNLPSLMSALDKDIEDDPDFAENVAKLTNVQVVALAQASLAGNAQQAMATQMLLDLVPNVLRFLSNEYDDTSAAVFPAVNDVILVVGQLVNDANARRSMLSELLQAIILKMKYDESSDWGDEADAVEDAEFREMRARLRVYQDMIMNLDYDLYMRACLELVSGTFAGMGKHDWRQIELAMYQLYSYAEAVKTLARDSPMKSSAVAAQDRMLDDLFRYDVSRFQHPSVQFHFFEIVNRYITYLESRPDAMLKTLEAFIDGRGAHHALASVQHRSWYLFARFVKSTGNKLGNVAHDVLNAVQDLLVIEPAQQDAADEGNNSDSDDYAPASDPFENKLYLFEAMGTFLTAPAVPSQEQAALGTALLEPLFNNIERAVSQGEGKTQVEFLQHNISAIGRFAQGFPANTRLNRSDTTAWSPIFDRAASYILAAFDAQVEQSAIRDAARFAFARLINVAPDDRLLRSMPRLIRGIIEHSDIKQLTELLPFLGQIIFKLKESVKPVIDETLTPLLLRIFALLNAPVNGTDDVVQLGDLRRAYLTFALSLYSNRIDDVLFSEANRGVFEQFLASVCHCAAGNPDDKQDGTNGPSGSSTSAAAAQADAPTQRTAFAVLRDATATWCSWAPGRPRRANAVAQPAPGSVSAKGGSGKSNNSSKSNGVVATSNGVPAQQTSSDETAPFNRPLDGFDAYAGSTITPLCFAVGRSLVSAGRLRDAGAQGVLGEAATCLRQIWLMRGPLPITEALPHPPNAAQHLLDALENSDLRQFKQLFKEFLQAIIAACA